ncbi:zona pellucida sperm-binding protein 4-like isoform X2 [Alosa pseudoharengus]|uniref:zona pellucida sperm-binding protein 4-like isoform X2 n=1 Tax=Alosa pseudoharengus TaxID=34774 RepID=UPI003F886720
MNISMSRRFGTEVDGNTLRMTFRMLGFSVRMEKDLCAADMRRVLQEESVEDHSEMSCFVCVLLSHGDQGLLMGADGAYISIQSLASTLTSHHCHSLQGKPKLFFIQACRGQLMDSGVETDSVEPEEEEEFAGVSEALEEDFLCCHSTSPVTLHCTLDAQIILVVAKDVTLPRLNLDSVIFLGGSGEPSCRPVDSNSGFAIYQFAATACGTLMREENDQLIYENKMTSSYEVGIGPRGSITRDSFYEVSLQCRYTGISVKALLVEVLPVPPPFGADQPGPLRVELRLGNGVCASKGCMEESVAYTSYYSQSDYPVTKVLRDPVYVEVRLLERTDPNIVLTLGNCWTTPFQEPTSMPQWDLLVDGCPYMDDRYLTTLVPISQDVDFPSHYRRFILKMFTFVDIQFTSPPQETVYIHCKTSVCQPSAGVSCEPSCMRYKRDVSAVKQEEAAVIVSSGAVRIKA